MGKGKLVKFAELESFENVYQKPEKELFKGKWHKDIFQNENPIVLELACGKGHYTLELARRFPDKNFIGIDIKGNRIHVGAREAIAEKLDNVRFLRIYIDHLEDYFAKEEVADIWITFPDPYLKESKSNKRLTSPVFLNRYKNVLSAEGTVQLKTDSPELFAFTQEIIEEKKLEVIQKIDDVYEDTHNNHLLTEIQTYYETLHLKDGRTIRFIQFKV